MCRYFEVTQVKGLGAFARFCFLFICFFLVSVLGIRFIFHEKFRTHIKAVGIVQASKIHHSDKQLSMDFQGSPMIKTSPSSAGGSGFNS